MTDPAIDPVRAAIVATIAGVPKIGRVHDRERYAQQAAALLELYGWTDPDGPGTPEVRGWFVSLSAELYRGRRVGREIAAAEWRIVGLMGFDDAGASEHTIAALARSVVDALSADPTLGGTVNRQSDSSTTRDTLSGAQIRRIEPVMFAGLLTHRATLSLVTERFL